MPKDKLNEEFLNALHGAEMTLSAMGFLRDKYIEIGYAQFADFKSKNAKVQFVFGPSEWEISIVIYALNQKYSFGDLLKISAVLEWVNNNRYKEENGRNIQNEVLWFTDLLKVSLPILNS